MKQKRSSHRDSQAVEEWCKCGKCGPMLTEKECRYWHEEVSHYLNGNIRDESRNFALSKLEIFTIDDSWRSDASDCPNCENCKNFKSSLLMEHLWVMASANRRSATNCSQYQKILDKITISKSLVSSLLNLCNSAPFMKTWKSLHCMLLERDSIITAFYNHSY